MTRVIPLYPNKPMKPPAAPTLSGEMILLKEILLKELTVTIGKSLRGLVGPTPKKWLTPLQVCRCLNISDRTLRRLREEGGFPYASIAGRIYFDPVDIEKEMKRRKQTKLSNRHTR